MGALGSEDLGFAIEESLQIEAALQGTSGIAWPTGKILQKHQRI